MNKHLALLALCAALAGCGGGGGGPVIDDEAEAEGTGAAEETSGADASSGDAGSDEATGGDAGGEDAAATEPQDPAAVSQTADLVVPEDFLFSSAFPMTIEIDVSASNPDADYVTVCLPSAENAAEPDLGNCVIRSELDGGQLSSEIQATGDTTRLFTVLWDFAAPDAPVIQSFDVGPNANAIELN